MTRLDVVKEETEFKVKATQKHRIRIVLVVANVLIASYASYLLVSSIVGLVNKSTRTNQGDIITVLDKNEKESLSIFNSYVKEKADILDVATYGRYLITSTSRADHSFKNYSSSVRLLNLEDAIKDASSTGVISVGSKINLGNYLDKQIDLFSLTKGDYIVHDGEGNYQDYRALHYTGVDYYEDVVYSFPTEDGRRNKITIKGKASSPALVINVSTQEASLPANYYDVVIVNKTGTSVNWLSNSNLKVKEVESIKEAYECKSSYAINVVAGDTLYSSNYVSLTEGNKTAKITTGAYAELDSDDAIRELGGYVFNAGYGISGSDDTAKVSKEIHSVLTSSHVGKYTLTIGKDIQNPYTTIKSIFKF